MISKSSIETVVYVNTVADTLSRSPIIITIIGNELDKCTLYIVELYIVQMDLKIKKENWKKSKKKCRTIVSEKEIKKSKIS